MISIITNRCILTLMTVANWIQKWISKRFPNILSFIRRSKIWWLPDPDILIARRKYAQDVRAAWEETGRNYFEREKHLLDPTKQVGIRANFITSEIKRLKPKRVLEVGCGYGAIFKVLNEDLNLDLLVGCDFSSTQLKKAKEYLQSKRVNLILADASSGLPFKSKSFDVVFSSGVIMHLPPRQATRAR